MARNKIMKSYALDPALLERFEKWLATQDPAPSRTGCIETALRDFLDAREGDHHSGSPARPAGRRPKP